MLPVHGTCRAHELGGEFLVGIIYCKYTIIRILVGALTIRDETRLKFETLLDALSS